MPVTFQQLLRDSFMKPTELARYRLLSIGIVMRYIFFFITLMTVSAFVHFLLGFTAVDSALHTVKQYMTDAGLAWILYPFAFLFLFVSNTLLVMVHISTIAAVVLLMMKTYPVRLQFRQLWRIAAFALSWHYIAYSVSPFVPNNGALFVLAFAVTLFYTARAAMHFPPARRTVAK